ncbi:MAG: DUF3501 family protein [Pseudomonadales bacterium]|jgi:hypothetical protein|nr:DUF3501 family protein [Pseudomonadales bacterium]
MQSNKKLARADLWSLEEYSEKRSDFRTEVLAHKKNRQVRLGDHATLYFEDALTMKYQVQEMLRIEKIFTGPEIDEELGAYNPLIPDGSNWKATFMIEYPDAEERRVALTTMPGIEHKVWVKVGDNSKIYANANDDLERSNEEKASAVHFMRFELDAQSVADAKAGKTIAMGIDHDALPYSVDVSAETAASLAADLSS